MHQTTRIKTNGLAKSKANPDKRGKSENWELKTTMSDDCGGDSLTSNGGWETRMCKERKKERTKGKTYERKKENPLISFILF